MVYECVQIRGIFSKVDISSRRALLLGVRVHGTSRITNVCLELNSQTDISPSEAGLIELVPQGEFIVDFCICKKLW